MLLFQIRNYYVASAMRSIGIGAAGGVAEIICGYITKGLPSFDMYNLDIQVKFYVFFLIQYLIIFYCFILQP